MDHAAFTCTGSVTLGSGSDDPPPNKVEMVFPSSRTGGQKNISRFIIDMQNDTENGQIVESLTE